MAIIQQKQKQIWVLLGAECTGKSTLATYWAQHLGALLLDEFSRTWVENNQRAVSDDDVAELVAGQMAQDCLALNSTQPVVMDTNLINTLAYAHHYHQQAPQQITQHLQQYAQHSQYIVCAADIPWKIQQYTRPAHDNRIHINQSIINLLKQYGCTYQIVSGSIDTRIMQLKKYSNQTR